MAIQPSPPPSSTLQPLPAPPPQTVELLPDPVLPAIARPLATVGDHTYAAIWPYVRRDGAKEAPSRELIFVRDDGQLLVNPGQPNPAEPPAPYADAALPDAVSLLPPHCLWSAAGLQRYLAGHRPDPAEVYRRLVAVLTHFVDFTGSLSGPDWRDLRPHLQPDLSVPPAAEVLAAYLLTTWFAPAFPSHGLLWITGDHGSGKTRLLHLLARLCHLGVPFPGLPSSDPLLRLAGLGASLACDNATFLSGGRRALSASTAAARQAILLAGRQRGALWPGFHRSHSGSLHDISGPRLFATTHEPEARLAGSCLVIPLARTADPSRAVLDPADPAAWPAGINPIDLTDDLWALALSRLPQLPPHLAPVAERAAQQDPNIGARFYSLQGAALQPWHALLAVASWLSAQSGPPPDPKTPIEIVQLLRDQVAYAAYVDSERARTQGVAGLYHRVLAVARHYHTSRPTLERADLTVLALRALFALVQDSINSSSRDEAADEALLLRLFPQLAGLDRGENSGDGVEDDDDDDSENGDDDSEEDDEEDDPAADDGNDSNDFGAVLSVIQGYDIEKAIKADDLRRAGLIDDGNDTNGGNIKLSSEPRPPTIQPSYAFTAEDVAAAMIRATDMFEWYVPPESLNLNLVGRLLANLRLRYHRTAKLRLWSVRPADLVRLSKAYSEPLPTSLAQTLSQYPVPPDTKPLLAP